MSTFVPVMLSRNPRGLAGEDGRRDLMGGEYPSREETIYNTRSTRGGTVKVTNDDDIDVSNRLRVRSNPRDRQESALGFVLVPGVPQW